MGVTRAKRSNAGHVPALALVENPDILATVAHRNTLRPKLVVGFAAETDRVIEHAREKLARKGCDWILANDVSPQSGVMGGDRNSVHLVSAASRLSKVLATAVSALSSLLATGCKRLLEFPEGPC